MLGLLRASFAQTPIYYQNGFRVTSTLGYVGAFFYGMVFVFSHSEKTLDA